MDAWLARDGYGASVEPAGWPARVHSVVTAERRSRALDVGIAVGLGAYAGLDALQTTDWPAPRPVSAVLAVTAAASLALRRSHPLAALVGSMGALSAVSVFLGHYEAGSSVLIALVATYSAAAYGRNRPFLLAVIAAFSATEGLQEARAEALPDVLWTAVALTLPVTVGLAVSRWQGRAHAAEQHARQLELDQPALAEAAALEERLRIARELHDVISHGLGVVMLQAGAAELVLERDPPKAREALRLIRSTGQQATAELSTLVSLVRDPPPPANGREPQPTLTDVDRLVAATKSAGLAVQLRRSGAVRELPAIVELNAYRVVQEGLTNALKHARAAQVLVLLQYTDRGIAVEVSDGGDGSRPGPGGRRGLPGLRERVEVFGGQFNAGPDPRGGWAVRASFPATP
jgi:signal transduction histidine kinase